MGILHVLNIASRSSGILVTERDLRSRSSETGRAMQASNRSTTNNKLLAAIPGKDFAEFFSDLHPVLLPMRQVLYEAGAPLEWVYFVEQGVT